MADAARPFCNDPQWRAGSGVCGWCGDALKGKTWFCRGAECGLVWRRNHWWTEARKAALERDGLCVRCGGGERLEVNHLEARGGAGYATSCAHHLEGLETLCHDCHSTIHKFAVIKNNPLAQKLLNSL